MNTPRRVRSAPQSLALIALGLVLVQAGCIPIEQDVPDSFRFYNQTETDVEIAVSNDIDDANDDAAFSLVVAGDSEAHGVTETCDGVVLVIREPGGAELERVETDAICGASEIFYEGLGQVDVDR